MRKIFLFLILFLISTFLFSQGMEIENFAKCGFKRPPFLTNYDITKNENLSHIPYSFYFSVRNTENIYINLMPEDISGIHVVTLIFIDPNGNIYSKSRYPISSDDSNQGEISIEGYKFPQKIKGGKIIRIGNLGRKRVIPIPFAVAGTYITNYHILGNWTLKIFIDGNEKPCYTLTFTIGE